MCYHERSVCFSQDFLSFMFCFEPASWELIMRGGSIFFLCVLTRSLGLGSTT